MKTTELMHWLLYEGRFNHDFSSFMDATCNKLVELGIPINRVRVSFRTLHPQVMAWTSVWDLGKRGHGRRSHQTNYRNRRLPRQPY